MSSATADPSTADPYPGPRPFRADEEGLFFGRDYEISQLRSLVMAHSLVLLYGQSGAGKTSLLRAGLHPALERREVSVFPVLRIQGSGSRDLAPDIENPYLAWLAANWAQAEHARLDGVGSLADFVARLATHHQASTEEPRALVLDQFEEIFTQAPEYWQWRADFFVHVGQALEADPLLRVVLGMREDYVAEVDPYAASVPNHFQHRFRIERLRRPQALAAVTGPLAHKLRKFETGAAEYLVDQLLQIRVEREGALIEVPGEFVEPVQLQIVCASLWERLDALEPPVELITTEHIQQLAKVSRALARFYSDVVARVAEHTGVEPLALRRWCEEQLITAGGTRALIYRGATETEGMPNEVINRLEAEHFIRGEERAGAHWYELSHDKFVEAIQRGNRQAFEEQAAVVSELGEQAQAWSAELDRALAELTAADAATRRTGLERLYPLVPAATPAVRETISRALAALIDDPADDIRREAANLSLVLHSETTSADYARATARYARHNRVHVSRLVSAGLILLLGLFGSLVAIAAVSSTVTGRWPVDRLPIGTWVALGWIALSWTLIYERETLENFALPGFRRSDRQLVHTLTAPFPSGWTEPYELLAVWPLNLIVPWAAAAAGAEVGVDLKLSYAAVFFPVLAAATAAMLMLYASAQVLGGAMMLTWGGARTSP